MNIHFAPVQGHTDAAYRAAHAALYMPADCYYTPFIRLEKGELRKRDLRDATGELNNSINLVPQVIFRDADELEKLVSHLDAAGIDRIDLNMGCPFPLQTSKGRGCAVIGRPDVIAEVANVTAAFPHIRFSAKVRLGLESADEWMDSIDAINLIRLEHITIHPRYGRQQYKGEADLEAFAAMSERAVAPVVYNGDIRTPDEASRIIGRFPNLTGIMIGRGLLARPSLVEEIKENCKWSAEKRMERLLAFHEYLLEYYRENLFGDAQILQKIKPFWEYLEETIGHKAYKAIKKATSMPKYMAALSLAGNV